MKTKLFFALFLSLFAVGTSYAQMSYVPNTAYRTNVGLAVGLATVYGDLPVRKAGPAGKVSFDYRISEFIVVGVEAQAGYLESGVKDASPTNGRYARDVAWGLYSKNFYQAGGINGKVYAGQFNENEDGVNTYINSVYLGLGVSYINNTISEIVETYPENGRAISGITKSSSGILIPFNIGIDVDIADKPLSLNINYQMNFSTLDEMDGYSIQGLSRSRDAYGLLSVGIKYHFGGVL